MSEKKFLLNIMDELSIKGANKSQCKLTHTEKFELNIANEEVRLFRTTFDKNLSIKIIKEQKKAELTINKLTDDDINNAYVELFSMADQSEPDEFFDIAEKEENGEFSSGSDNPDIDKMYTMTQNIIKYISDKYVNLNMEESALSFVKTKEHIINSNGVDFVLRKGKYDFTIVFTSKDGEKSSSFNYTDISMEKLEKELYEFECLDRLLGQSIEHINAKPLEGKFDGKVIVTPECLESLLYYYSHRFLGDMSIMTNKSRMIGKLGEKVASDKFSFELNPISREFVEKEFITSDGYKAENMKVIDKGILNSYVLSQYAAKKTGNVRSKNNSYAMVVPSGEKTLEELVEGIDRGVLLCRFSGGMPSANGDFSGVAKNSFYIENGKIMNPINETMISGNLYDLFNDIIGISKESVNNGGSKLPWIACDNIVISGK